MLIIWKMVSLCLVFSYFISLLSRQYQENLRILLVLLKVQLKAALPGHHLKMIFIASLFAIGVLFQVTRRRFNSISGKINLKLESSKYVDGASEPQSCLHSNCDGPPLCLDFKNCLHSLWTPQPLRWLKLRTSPILLVLLDFLTYNLYTLKPRERKSLDCNTHICLPSIM